MAVPELLRRLLTAPGPSGYETPATAVWREAASEFGEGAGDPLGSEGARAPRPEPLTRGGSVPGVVGRKWSKRPKPHEKRPAVELDDLHVDIGARSREEALELLQGGEGA